MTSREGAWDAMRVPVHVEVIAETIALMEAQLGHIPEHRVAVQGLTSRPGGPAKGFGIGPLVTVSAEDATGRQRGLIAQRVGAQMTGSDVVIIACYTMTERDAITISAAIRAECEAQGAQVVVDESGFRELPGPSPHYPRAVIEQTTWAAKRTELGRAVVPAGDLTPVPDLTDTEKAAIAAARARHNPTGPGAADGAALPEAVAALGEVLGGRQPADDPGSVAAILAGLRDRDSRDVLMVAALPGGTDLARKAADGQWDKTGIERLFSGVIMGLAAPPEPRRLDRCLAVMARAGAAGTGHEASNAYSINAFVCFAAGDRARVRGWLDHAEHADPTAKLPNLLRTTLRIGLGPTPAWQQPTPATTQPGHGPRQL